MEGNDMVDRESPIVETQAGADLNAVWDALATIIDPEIGLDVVTVGLVYDVWEEDEPGHVRVVYTLTTRGCPMGAFLEQGMAAAVRRVPGVEDVEMELTWDPPWSPDMMGG